MEINKTKNETKLNKIKKVVKWAFNQCCIKCGSEIDEVVDPNNSTETILKCVKCSFTFCRNWQHDYILEIERILKEKEECEKYGFNNGFFQRYKTKN